MEIESWYSSNFEGQLKGRYISPKMIFPILEKYKYWPSPDISGTSEQGQPIPLIKIGEGKKIVLAWSQMHGNESTTTKALFDLIKFLNQESFFQNEIQQFLKSHSLYIIPMLNPDGANLYTRENANKVDLNRDAQNLSQSESRFLREVFDKLKPDLCLNMHDQRTIYGFDDGRPATISFLSPSADEHCSLTDARKVAMEGVVKMGRCLQKYIPGQVGRYDESFNSACVGDTFQMAGVPTILFEAGHYKEDYQREKTRELIFYAVLTLLDIIGEDNKIDFQDYYNLPENRKNYRDIVLRDVNVKPTAHPVDIAIQYLETLKKGKIEFVPIISEMGALNDLIGHFEKNINFLEILTNTDKKLTIGVKVLEFNILAGLIPLSFH